MTDVDITVPVEVAEDVLEQQNDKAQRMENVLDSFLSNELSDTEAYEKLMSEQQEVVENAKEIESRIEEVSPDGLAELFG